MSFNPHSFSCAIYGMGKMGRSLFMSLYQNEIPIIDIYSRNHPEKCDLDFFLKRIANNKTQILFLAVPDDAVETIAKQLANEKFLPPHIAHLSGTYSFEILRHCQNAKSLTQFHVLASLDGENPIPEEALNAICSNTPKGTHLFFRLSNLLHLKPVILLNHNQALYHAAASFAGNLPTALIAEAMTLLKEAGIDENLARKSLAKLLRTTANAIEQYPLSQALTGPIARGDVQTIQKHLDALEELPDASIKILYRLLSQKLLPLTNHSKKDEMRNLLNEERV